MTAYAVCREAKPFAGGTGDVPVYPSFSTGSAARRVQERLLPGV